MPHPHGYAERRETPCCADPFHDRSRIVHDLDDAAEEERVRLSEDRVFDAQQRLNVAIATGERDKVRDWWSTEAGYAVVLEGVST